jgi:2-oxoglutarate dehydrogenase E1 component
MANSGIVEIQMPQMGESVTEGTVLEWHKREGEFVEEGETVVEVSTDKVDAEVPAPASGTITKILKGEDETIEVGSVLAELDPTAEPSGDGASAEPADAGSEPGPGISMEGGGEGDADLGEGPGPEQATGAPGLEAPAGVGELVQIRMPEMGESVTEGTILEWHRREGDSVEEGETVVEVSTDKVDAEVPAPASGTITKIQAQVDETVQVGQVLAEISATAATQGEPARASDGVAVQDAEPAAPSAPKPAGNGAEGEASGGVTHKASGGVIPGGVAKVSPVARRIAAASGVDLSVVKGSGPGGKVIKADVLAAADGGDGVAVGATALAGEVKPLRGPAAMLAQAMNESRSMPTATSFRTLPVDVLDAKRKALNGVLKDRGMKVSFTHLVAWAIVHAATEWPVMARVYQESDGKPQVVEPGSVNLGIAVDVERRARAA